MNFIHYHLLAKDLCLQYHDVLKILQVPDRSLNNPVVSETIQLVDELENIANIHGGYIIYDEVVIDKDKGSIHIEKKQINPGKKVCGYMNSADKIAVFVCTAGSGFSSYSNKYNHSGDYLKGFIVDTLGSLVVEKSMDLIQQKLEDEFLPLNLQITNRYSPGYCNWPTNDQQQLFSLLPENPCNIQLMDSSLMIPIKSVSGIIGIGKEAKKRAYACSVCNDKNCVYRKTNKELA